MWPFLSSLAQDFIEESDRIALPIAYRSFLSSLAQDFIEERASRSRIGRMGPIPELSSSGLH